MTCLRLLTISWLGGFPFAFPGLGQGTMELLPHRRRAKRERMDFSVNRSCFSFALAQKGYN